MSICLDLPAAAHERAGLSCYAARLAQAMLRQGPNLRVFINDPRESRLRPPLSNLLFHTAHPPRKRWRLRARDWVGWASRVQRYKPRLEIYDGT